MLKTGIKIDVNLLILLMPPRIIKKARKQNIIPNHKEENGERETTELTCTKFPVVKEFKTQSIAKAQPRILAALFPSNLWNPSLM